MIRYLLINIVTISAFFAAPIKTAAVNTNNIGLVKVEKIGTDDIPQMMNIQGYIDSAGTAVNHPVDIEFSIWTDSSAGSRVWGFVTRTCSLENGLFNTKLDVQDTVFRSGNRRWLQLKVIGAQDPFPRIEITSVGFAFRSVKSDTASYATSISRPVTPPITRADVASNFKAPYSDTADYARVTGPADSARITANSHKLQGKDTIALDNRYLNEGQVNSVSNTMIQNDVVTTAKILDGTINSADIKDTTIITAKIKDGAVTTPKIADGAVTTPKIADGAVTSSKIQNGTITRQNVVSNFKSPYCDTADYVHFAPAVDSARVAGNSYQIENQSLSDLDGRFVNENQTGSISVLMIQDSSISRYRQIISGDIIDETDDQTWRVLSNPPMQITVTPTSNSSKFLILFNFLACSIEDYELPMDVRIKRTAPDTLTLVRYEDLYALSGISFAYPTQQFCFQCVDAPNTNESVTYEVQWRKGSSRVGTIRSRRNRVFTVIELTR